MAQVTQVDIWDIPTNHSCFFFLGSVVMTAGDFGDAKHAYSECRLPTLSQNTLYFCGELRPQCFYNAALITERSCAHVLARSCHAGIYVYETSHVVNMRFR